MIRLKDIAQHAGVSVMTVSKALRDEPDISGRTKAKIRQLADQFGYVPNTAARSLRLRSTKFFGLVIPAMTNPIYARVVMAIEEQAHALGYEIILTHSLNNLEREEECIRRLLARRVDGLFIHPVYRRETTARIYDDLLRRGTPTVLLGQRAAFCARFINVETDDLAASKAVTNHLLELGHRRIACFAGQVFAPTAQERFEGYRRALREAGIEIEDKLMFNAGSTIEEGAKAALQMIDEGVRATAIQCVNDLVAIGAATTFMQQGIRIPQDLSIVGYGNILSAEHFRVPLTTVRQPKFRQGIAAMESMLKLLGGQPIESKRLHAEIIVRDSTGPAPKPDVK